MDELPTPIFDDIQAILNWLVKGKTQNLDARHGPTFGWDTRQELLDAVVELGAQQFRLIDPAMVGNDQGGETNLAKVLSPAGLDGLRMPWQGNDEGKYATELQLATIIAWIDAGANE